MPTSRFERAAWHRSMPTDAKALSRSGHVVQPVGTWDARRYSTPGEFPHLAALCLATVLPVNGQQSSTQGKCHLKGHVGSADGERLSMTVLVRQRNQKNIRQVGGSGGCHQSSVSHSERAISDRGSGQWESHFPGGDARMLPRNAAGIGDARRHRQFCFDARFVLYRI